MSWTAVHGSGITYTVCYSTTSGTQSDPPSGAKCSANGITGTSTTLSPLSKGTTYYIWVAAVSSDGWEAYSDIHRARIHKGKLKWITAYTLPCTYCVDMYYILGTHGTLNFTDLYNVQESLC